MEDVLYTLGYEHRTLEEFLEILRASHIDVLLDVRDVPWSHKAGFSKRPLSEALHEAGITYIHARFAGNPKALRRAANGIREAISLYREHLAQNPEILVAFDELVAEHHARGERVAMLCVERDPNTCHRSVLGEAWVHRKPGRRVEHLGLA